MEQPSPLDTLRRQHQAVLEYEESRSKRRGPRHPRELRPHLSTLDRHLAQWKQVGPAAGSEEESPLLALREEWRGICGIPDGEPQEPPKKAATSKPKATKKSKAAHKKGDAKKDTHHEGAESQASGAAPTQPPAENGAAGADEGEGGDDPTYKILGKGDWVKSHAKIVREEIPRVKATAADPESYLKAKRAFLKRNLPLLTEYAKKPEKAHSPLFAYCVLFLSDAGQTEKALALAEKAVELLQTSAIKRNFHELLFDVRLAQLEREAPEMSRVGKGPRFDAFTALREQLMADPFRGNHAKAKVLRIYAQVCMAVGDYSTAQDNLQQVRFLDPNMGVDTLMAKCAEQLSQ